MGLLVDALAFCGIALLVAAGVVYAHLADRLVGR